ncbi:hypothetical protein BJ166DRAFT_379618 [Pestalotiopsis sp. NC0098]|nr:hypothetical protein BJ166DRAFT_379618 [Pestalotiopsis sp. NC0098]
MTASLGSCTGQLTNQTCGGAAIVVVFVRPLSCSAYSVPGYLRYVCIRPPRKRGRKKKCPVSSVFLSIRIPHRSYQRRDSYFPVESEVASCFSLIVVILEPSKSETTQGTGVSLAFASLSITRTSLHDSPHVETGNRTWVPGTRLGRFLARYSVRETCRCQTV